jgi:hypothetical protein
MLVSKQQARVFRKHPRPSDNNQPPAAPHRCNFAMRNTKTEGLWKSRRTLARIALPDHPRVVEGGPTLGWGGVKTRNKKIYFFFFLQFFVGWCMIKGRGVFSWDSCTRQGLTRLMAEVWQERCGKRPERGGASRALGSEMNGQHAIFGARRQARPGRQETC